MRAKGSESFGKLVSTNPELAFLRIQSAQIPQQGAMERICACSELGARFPRP